MKKYPFLFLLLGLVAAVTACKLYYPAQKPDYAVKTGPAQVKEGKRLTELMCSPCHYDSQTKKLTGIRMQDIPGFVGKVYSANLTRHPEKGIGTYTDGELVYLLRTGVARNGKLMPYMQRPNLADDDLQAIIAFLRSDDELVKASDVELPETRYTPMGKLGLSKFSKPLPYTGTVVTRPGSTDKINQGKYLVDNLGCFDCHSASFTSINKLNPEQSKGYMGGGNKMKNGNGKTVQSPNLTFHETGIGSWSEQEFRRALKEGFSKDNAVLGFPMPLYNDLKDTEVEAIYAYLKSLPKIDNQVKHNHQH
jgi:hypothetical protein